MKVIATIQTDLEATPIGTRSRLADELAGVPILRRTVERVRRAKNVAEIYVLCPTAHHSRCTTILEGTGAIVRSHDAQPAPYGSLIQAARKWSLNGWRGGIGGTTVFDEYADGRLIVGLLKAIHADAVLSVPPAAVVFDPDLADRMIEQRKMLEDESRLVFAQAPPGVAGIILDATLISELVTQNIPIGWLFSYQPDGPRKDLIFQPCCYETPAQLRFAAGRVIADTDRAMQALADLLRHHPDPDSLTVGQWLIERDANYVEQLPREVEIELTTEDPYPNALLHQRGNRVPRRGPLDLAVLERIAAELKHYDDSLVVLGGFGDPLKHPQFCEVLEILRPLKPFAQTSATSQGKGLRQTPSRFRANVFSVSRPNGATGCSQGWSPDGHRDGTPGSVVPPIPAPEGRRKPTDQGIALDNYFQGEGGGEGKKDQFLVRSCGSVYGLCVRTTGVDLNDATIEAIVDHGVDILNVVLDAWSTDLYGRLHAPHDPPSECLEAVLSRMDRLSKVREQHASPRPIILPDMTKARDNVHELDEFYDGWLRRLGAVSLTGFSHYARQCDDRSVIKMAPSTRTPCRRIRSRCLVLADGRVTLCDQDFKGLHTVGTLREQSLAEIWRCAEFDRLRAAHQSGRFDPLPLCAACDEWHRP